MVESLEWISYADPEGAALQQNKEVAAAAIPLFPLPKEHVPRPVECSSPTSARVRSGTKRPGSRVDQFR
jgi:hypothetical protein